MLVYAARGSDSGSPSPSLPATVSLPPGPHSLCRIPLSSEVLPAVGPLQMLPPHSGMPPLPSPFTWKLLLFLQISARASTLSRSLT